MLCTVTIILLNSVLVLTHSLEFKYHNNSELEEYLKDFVKSDSKGLRLRLYSIGKSSRSNELWVVEISAAKERKLGVPNVKLIGTIHGNEPVGREVLLHFMEYLRDNYQTDSTIRWLLDRTKIHILPGMNPDGFAMASMGLCEGEHGRNNGDRGKDLNRNFPDYYHHNYMIPQEPETRAVINWMANTTFILSAGLHGGALVANYPFDTVKERKWQKFFRNIKNVANNTSEAQRLRHEYIASLPKNPPSLTADDDVFRHLAQVYAQNHLTMHRGLPCNGSPSAFNGGITNGAEWYPLTGGMQDYNYAMHGTMELTLEISCCKYPSFHELPELWEQNKLALVKYCLEAHRGVTGQIVDSITRNPISGASLKVVGRNMTFTTATTGEFWRLLLPGSYELQVSAPGYYEQVVPFQVKNYKNNLPKLTFLTVALLNASVTTTTTTTTTQQSTTLTTARLAEAPTDGTSTTDAPAESIRKPTFAKQTSEFQLNIAASTPILPLFFYLVLSVMLF